MPMPKPKDGEKEQDFISRFMADEIMVKDYPEEKQRVAIAMAEWKKKEKKMHELDTVDFRDQELFSVGVWNGDQYTEEDFDETIKLFNENRGKHKPYFKLGHSNENHGKLFYSDKAPAIGWVDNIRRVGKKLVGDILRVPKLIADAIESKAYGRLSPEFLWYKENGQLKKKITAVSLLGARTPACDTVEDFVSLYYGFEGDVKAYDDIIMKNQDDRGELKEYTNLESVMNPEEIKKQYEEQIQKEKELLKKEYEDQMQKLKDESEAKVKEYAEKLEAKENEAFTSSVKSFIDAAVKDGKISPAKSKLYSHLAMRDKLGVKEYAEGEEVKAYENNFDVIKELVNMSNDVDTTEQTEHVEVDKAYEQADTYEAKGEEMDKMIKAYQEKHSVSYTAAFEAVANELREKE